MSAADGSPPLSLDQIQSTLVYRNRAPIGQVRADLAALAELDREIEELEKNAQQRTTMFGCGTALALVATIFSIVVMPGLAIVTGPVFVGLLIVAVKFARQWSRYSRLNLENRRYEVVGGLLRYLSSDMAADAPVNVEIDFHGYREGRFLKAQDKGGMFSSTSAYSYQAPWLSLEGKLLDGNRFALSATLLVKRKEKRKRKYTKVREAFRERVELRMQVKAPRYPALNELAQRVQAVKLKGPFEPLDWRVENDQVLVIGTTAPHLRNFGRGSSPTNMPPSDALMQLDDGLKLFVTAYEGLALCRPPAKPG